MGTERLRLTPSEDGKPRATMRVEFRIDLRLLVRAAGYAIEFETCGTAAAYPPREALTRLTRAEILEACRLQFHEYGEVGADSASGENLGNTSAGKTRLRGIAEARVRELFPEFAPPNQGEETR